MNNTWDLILGALLVGYVLGYGFFLVNRGVGNGRDAKAKKTFFALVQIIIGCTFIAMAGWLFVDWVRW